MKDIMMPCALTVNDEPILINSIKEYNRHEEYKCPICGNKVVPCSILENNKYSAYFRHKDKVSCNAESMIHYWYKNQYIITGDKFYISIDGFNIEYTCKETIIEKEYNTIYGVYKPDVTVITTNNEKIFFEYKYTNKKDPETYSNKWRELDCTVVEIDIKTLQDIEMENKIFKPLFYDGVVQVKTRNSEDSIIREHIRKNNIEDRKRILYLNGLLRDCYRYNIGEITIGDIVLIIDSMNEVDKEIIPKLLKSLKCNSILDDYCNYKYLYYKNNIKSIISEMCNNDSMILKCVPFDNLDMIYSRKFCKISYGIKFNNVLHVMNRYVEYGENIFGTTIKEDVLHNYAQVLYNKAKDINNDRIYKVKMYRKNKIRDFIYSYLIYVPKNEFENETLSNKYFLTGVVNNYESNVSHTNGRLSYIKELFDKNLKAQASEYRKQEKLRYIQNNILEASSKYIRDTYRNNKVLKDNLTVDFQEGSGRVYICTKYNTYWVTPYDRFIKHNNSGRIADIKNYLDIRMNEIINKCKVNRRKEKKEDILNKYLLNLTIVESGATFKIHYANKQYRVSDVNELGICTTIDIDKIKNILNLKCTNRKILIRKYLLNKINEACYNKYKKYNSDICKNISSKRRLYITHSYIVNKEWSISFYDGDYKHKENMKYTGYKLTYNILENRIILILDGEVIEGTYCGSNLELIIFVKYLIDKLCLRYKKIYKNK